MKYLLDIGGSSGGGLAGGTAVTVGGGIGNSSAAGGSAKRGSSLAEYLSSADPATASFVKDYSRRILSRITDDSDDENNYQTFE